MDYEYLTARIVRVKELIEALENAMESALTGGVLSFTLDTGQSREVVTYRSIGEIRNALDGALNRLATLEARRDGSAGYGGANW